MADEPRAKRQKSDRFGRSAALEKLRNLKGSKNKYIESQVENVYDTVDEKEYTKKVLSRQDDDWIVDDDGSGYLEDGREIFDDDLDAESIAAASSSKRERKRKKGAVVNNAAPKANIQFMLSNMQTKKKKEEVKLDEDDILSELISEIDTPDGSNKSEASSRSFSKKITEKKAARDYMKSFNIPKSKPTPKPVTLPPVETNSRLKSENVLKEIKINVAYKTSVEPSPIDEAIEETVPDVEVTETTVIIESKKNGVVAGAEEANGDNSSDDEIYADVDISGIEEFDKDFDDAEEKMDVANENVITEDQLTQGWDTLQSSIVTESIPETVLDTSSLPTVLNQQNEKVIRFYWLDAFETATQPGTVYLIGKIYCKENTYASCCVVVKDVYRKVFLLPRVNHKNDASKPVTALDVYKEFNGDIAERLDIKEYKSRKVNKNYAFDSNVPKQSDYLEVRYSSKYAALPSDLSGNTFSRIFGAQSSFIELLLLDRKIKGPCWFDIQNFEPAVNPVSWCKFELICTNMTDIQMAKCDKPIVPPPLVVAGINMRTVINPKTSHPEIVMLTCLSHNNHHLDKEAPNPPFQQHFCVISKPSFQALPLDLYDGLQKTPSMHVQKCDNERAMLNYFINQFSKLDADLIVAHDIQIYLKDILLERICATGASNWSKLGRLKRSVTISASQKYQFSKDLFIGRLICDLKLSAQELKKSRSYDLDTLCQMILKLKEGQRVDVEAQDVPRLLTNTPDIIKLIAWTLEDTAYIMKMANELNVLPIALQITNIAGNILSRTLLGGRSERNEFLLLHAFDEKGYIVPEKRIKSKDDPKVADKRSNNQRKKPTYSGGLVLDPKVGFYDKFILLMDFNSLYPSIIQEYNICFTTISIDASEEDIVLPDTRLPPGILPTEIRKLVESRREVKKLMKAPELSKDLRMQYDIRQLALKLTANSMYGCLGFSQSRFFGKNLAALITMKGREILTNTKELVEKMNYEVIYGDTDSIMVNTHSVHYDDVYKVGSKIKQEINKLYRQVELDIDGVFKYLLLLKKKKYAAVTIAKLKSGDFVTELEYKGLDIVRRDWCSLATEAGKVILNHIFMDQSQDDRIEYIHSHLRKLKEDLTGGKVPLSLLVITKQLTKDPRQYADAKALPHVQVALRYNSKGGKPLRKGDTVPYVICDDGSKKAHTQRAYHIEELKNNATLKVDVNYYLAQQIHPIVERICGPIEGTDAYALANALGIEGHSFKAPSTRTEATRDLNADNKRKLEFKFRNAEPFRFVCVACHGPNTVKSFFSDGDAALPFLAKCCNEQCKARPVDYLPAVANQLTVAVRAFVRKYYRGELTCEDPACSGETNVVPDEFDGNYPVCPACEMGVMYEAYSEGDLYNQLIFYHHIFDSTTLEKKPLMDASIESGYELLKETVNKYIKSCAYAVVDLTSLFERLIPKSTKFNNNNHENVIKITGN